MINFYDHIPDSRTQYHNPNGNAVNIWHPFRAAICGSSGSRKTNTLLNLLNYVNCFDKYYIFAKLMEDDPLYDKVLVPKLRQAEEKVGVPILMEYSNTLDDLPSIEDGHIDSEYQNICIFDDMVDESNKDLKQVSSYFRKMRKRNCSMVFVSQDYFSMPKPIRRNCNIFIFTRSSSDKDLQQIFQDLAKSDFASFQEFKSMFIDTTEEGSALIIDPCHPKIKYRKNFTQAWEPV